MNGSLLDTNIVIALFRGDISVKENLEKAEKVFIPAVVLGELYYGAFRSRNVEDNTTRIAAFVASVSVLNCDAATSRFYGLIKNGLREKGRPIPENDIWIAAVAIQNDLVLVSRDEHFKWIEGLKLDTW